MLRFTDDELLAKALAAIEAVEKRARQGPIAQTPELRFVLAYLANRAPERWPFDEAWKQATRDIVGGSAASGFGRRQSLLAAINGIYLQLGVRRPQ